MTKIFSQDRPLQGKNFCSRCLKCRHNADSQVSQVRFRYSITRLMMKKPNNPAAEAFMGCGRAPPVTSAGSESVVSASSVGNGVAGVFVALPDQAPASTVTVVLMPFQEDRLSGSVSEMTAAAGGVRSFSAEGPPDLQRALSHSGST